MKGEVKNKTNDKISSREFLENCQTDHIIFEKVLFQKDEDFKIISN